MHLPLNPKPVPPSSLVLSYVALRRAIGGLGSSLPLTLVLGKLLLQGPGLEPSISAYYYTVMHDVLVGTLCALGVFLMGYRGYARLDHAISSLAGLCAIGMALFPTAPAELAEPNGGIHASAAQVHIGWLHWSLAIAFFLLLSWYCLALFRKTAAQPRMALRKRQRNRIYTVCGYGMLLCMALVLVVKLLPVSPRLAALEPVFWLETVAIELFGFSWLVKGQVLLKDDATARTD